MLSLVTLSLPFLLTFATAQSTAVTWLEPGPAAGAFSYAGAVLDACPGTTIIALQCTSGGADNAYSDICGTDGPSMTMTIGPSQVHFHGSTSTPGLDYEMDMTCDINESSATCTDSTSWSAVETSTESVETSTVAVASMATHTAEITEGAKKLDHTGKCTGVSKSEKGKGDKSSGERLAVSMGVVGLTSFVGMLLL